MKKKGIIPLCITLAIVILSLSLIAASVYVVSEDEYAIKTAFEKVVGIDDTAGIKFKIPIIHTVTYLPKNDMLYDIDPSVAITFDKKNLNVDSYCVWRIANPLAFWQQVGGDTSRGARRIDAQTYNATKNKLGSMTQDEILAERDGVLDTYITNYVKDNVEELYGIEIVNVRIKQIVPPQDNLNAIYDRMISEREQISTHYKAEGVKAAKIVRNEADKERDITISAAESESAKLVAEGEREYMKILAEAYGSPERKEFYEFIRAMDALKEAVSSGKKTIVLPLDSPLAKWFVQK